MNEPQEARKPSETWLPDDVLSALNMSAVSAIKSLQSSHGMSLWEAKNIIDGYLVKHPGGSLFNAEPKFPPELSAALSGATTVERTSMAAQVKCLAFGLVLKGLHKTMDLRQAVPTVFALKSYVPPIKTNQLVRHVVISNNLYCLCEHAIPHWSSSTQRWFKTSPDEFLLKYMRSGLGMSLQITALQLMKVDSRELIRDEKLHTEHQLLVRRLEIVANQRLQAYVSGIRCRLLLAVVRLL